MGCMTPPAAGGAKGSGPVDDPGLSVLIGAKEIDRQLEEGACGGGGAGVMHLAVDQGRKVAGVTGGPNEAGVGDKADILPAGVGMKGGQ
ncbi:hypothetical protein AX15_007526 [Amanita polypyramis BW_CC]|nr:hypothetical protein AX15_007526 [Amanita polypyramis BW_CC]